MEEQAVRAQLLTGLSVHTSVVLVALLRVGVGAVDVWAVEVHLGLVVPGLVGARAGLADGVGPSHLSPSRLRWTAAESRPLVAGGFVPESSARALLCCFAEIDLLSLVLLAA